jgi:hypothetical protein
VPQAISAAVLLVTPPYEVSFDAEIDTVDISGRIWYIVFYNRNDTLVLISFPVLKMFCESRFFSCFWFSGVLIQRCHLE